MNWESLIAESAIASVLPDAYARFARPVSAALGVFLDGLDSEHQASVLAEQAALGPTASVSARLGQLARSCPVLHKLGQVLARDRRLASDLRRHLRELESLPPAVPYEEIEKTLAAELGPLDRRGVILAPQALAEASVAVVIPFQQAERKGQAEKSRPESLARTARSVLCTKDSRPLFFDGVFKILKPGIEERLEHELELLADVGAHLDQRCDELNIPHLDYQEAFEQVRDKLRWEIRLDQEQVHLARMQNVYADEPQVQIPTLFEHCTPRITAMERVTGGKVTDCTNGAVGKRQLADLVVSALICRPVFEKASPAPFHGDPHAGNLFLTDEGRLAILDWSLVGELGECERVAIVQIVLGALTLDGKRIASVLADLAEGPALDRPALASVVDAHLRQIRHGEFPGLSWLIGILDEAVQSARLRLSADLMLFRKTLHTLEGVVDELGGDQFQIDQIFCREFLHHFAVEWPGRWTALPNSREFATRLSNADLTKWMLSLPTTAVRLWLDQIDDLWGNRGRIGMKE